MGCCKSRLTFENLRRAEKELLAAIAEHVNQNGTAQLLIRDVFVEAPDDPTAKHAIIHFLELRPRGVAGDAGGKDLFSSGDCIHVEGWPSPVSALTQGSESDMPAPMVMLPGFGMGAAAYAGCIERLLMEFPERRIFILDWPSCGAAARSPFNHEARARSVAKLAGSSTSSTASPVHEGVCWIGDGESAKPSDDHEASRKPYPLPEKRMLELIELWRQRVGLARMVLLGHSMGGCIAFNYADAHPQFVDRLVLCSPCGVPRRPDACGLTEDVYLEWYRRKQREDPDCASEFSSGSAIRMPRARICDCIVLSCACLSCVLWVPLLLLGYLLRRLLSCMCGCCATKETQYRDKSVQNGVSADFIAEWSPLRDIGANEMFTLYEKLAVPRAQVLTRQFPAFLGRRALQLFAECRIRDNGQWMESRIDEPQGLLCDIVAGHRGVPDSAVRTAADGASAAITSEDECLPNGAADVARPLVARRSEPSGSSACKGKISQMLFAEYQYCSTAFGDADFNWGEMLFGSLLFPGSYGSFGWSRRPFGRRLEQFLGLPPNFEGGTEFYDEARPGVQVPMVMGSSEEGTSSHGAGVPVAFFYGQFDWMDFRAAKLISQKVERHSGKHVPVLRLRSSGHQMFLDNPKGFVQGIRMLVPS